MITRRAIVKAIAGLAVALAASFASAVPASSMLAARQTILGGTKWQNPYDAGTLVAMWDGEWNAGPGRHDANATVWRNVVPGAPSLVISGFSHYWDAHSLRPAEATQQINSGNPDVSAMPYTSEGMLLSSNFTIEVVLLSNSSAFRRWSSKPWTNRFESWKPSGQYLERIYDTRIGANISNEGCYFATRRTGTRHIFTFYDVSGAKTSSTGTISSASYVYNGVLAFAARLDKDDQIFAIRIHSRALTDDEIAANYAVDKARFNLPPATH